MLPSTIEKVASSGILEAYLLGLTQEEEDREIQAMMADNPALFLHLDQLDTDLDAHFRQVAVPPPPAIRDLLKQRIAEPQLPEKHRTRYYDSEPQTAERTAKPNYVDVEVDNTHIRVHKNWRPAFVAIFILSKVFLIASLYFYFKADSQAQEITRLKAEIQQTVSKPAAP